MSLCGIVLEWRLAEVAKAVAAVHGCTAELQYERIFSTLVNDADCTATAIAVANSIVGEAQVDPAVAPVTGSEDFAFMLEHRPGNYIFLGNGVSNDGSFAPVHTPKYDFNDKILPLGVRYFVGLAQRELAA